jgi:hypothetical protein
MKLTFLLLTFLLPLSSYANERIRPGRILLAEGYKLTLPSRTLEAPEIPVAHSLPWPVNFQDKAHSVANAMAEFQPYGDPYFHGGCDLRVNAGADVMAPVSGKLEAGHYSYDTNADGSLKKYWKPWPESGDATYFEVAVVADDGIRYEFHHVNRSTLPNDVVAILNHGGGRVEKGMVLGHAIRWPDGVYHHIHYNVVLPDGTRVNPEYVSPLVADQTPPEVKVSYAVMQSGNVVRFGDGKFSESPKEFAIALVDRLDGSVYDHPVVYARLEFVSGMHSTWDFRRALLAENGKFPNLWDFFVQSLDTPDGYLETEGGYGIGVSVIRLKVPDGASGAFTITLGDIAGNSTTLQGSTNATGSSR